MSTHRRAGAALKRPRAEFGRSSSPAALSGVVGRFGGGAAAGCLGVVTDAKNDKAESFYQKYDFATVEEKKWPRRMFLPIQTVWSLFE